eukprot:TRINITY_DN66356_c1_g7_i1.p1 TRINITY_DN66356_c1_g7~~TRINITY_DN66356_c1_g7_i1.p1  ORF type:complete len:607 (+),score=349.25 TRINITY_DN66356_c1_g7_i1:231-1823(+)
MATDGFSVGINSRNKEEMKAAGAIPSRCVWVGNVSSDVTDDMLRERFSKFGTVLQARRFARSRCAFVTFSHSDEALACLELDGSQLAGLTLALNVGVASRHLWVGNIPPTMTEERLQQLFAEHGEIESVRLLSLNRCAFVNFVCVEDAIRALDEKHEFEVDGYKIAVNYQWADNRRKQRHKEQRRALRQKQRQRQQRQFDLHQQQRQQRHNAHMAQHVYQHHHQHHHVHHAMPPMTQQQQQQHMQQQQQMQQLQQMQQMQQMQQQVHQMMYPPAAPYGPMQQNAYMNAMAAHAAAQAPQGLYSPTNSPTNSPVIQGAEGVPGQNMPAPLPVPAMQMPSMAAATSPNNMVPMVPYLVGPPAAPGATMPPAQAQAPMPTSTSTSPKQLPSRQLFVGNLPPTLTVPMLSSLFAPFGDVDRIRLVANQPYGFVVFHNIESAIAARRHYNTFPLIIDGFQITVNFGKVLRANEYYDELHKQLSEELEHQPEGDGKGTDDAASDAGKDGEPSPDLTSSDDEHVCATTSEESELSDE